MFPPAPLRLHFNVWWGLCTLPIHARLLIAAALLDHVAAGSTPTLWYDRPAKYWEEALPVGNGRIGAMIYGGVLRDHIQLNEETIWSGTATPKLADPTFR